MRLCALIACEMNIYSDWIGLKVVQKLYWNVIVNTACYKHVILRTIVGSMLQACDWIGHWVDNNVKHFDTTSWFNVQAMEVGKEYICHWSIHERTIIIYVQCYN